MQDPKFTHGGHREGAGRKPFNPGMEIVNVNWKISAEAKQRIVQMSKERGVAIGDIINELTGIC